MNLLGLGTAVPDAAMDQDAAARLAAETSALSAQETRVLRALYRQSGIRRRHAAVAPGGCGQALLPPGADSAGPGTAERLAVWATEARHLSLAASREALAQSGVPPQAITHLVTVCCTGFGAPGFDLALLRDLGLSPSTERVHVGFMGCHGAINGLRVARALATRPGATVLLCCVEVCSVHFQYGWDPDRVTSNALFADGAAAAVIGEGPGPAIVATGSRVFPETEDAMSWHIGDHGFEMTLSARVPDLIAGNLREWLEGWLAGAGYALGGIGGFAIHPGGPRIVSAVGEALALPAEALRPAREVLAEYGNMSSPTVLFVVRRLLTDGARPPILLLAFGPGLTAEAALLG